MSLKILLLGDFSSLHKTLKEGLTSLGHQVTLASDGDGWKSIDRDIDLSSNLIFPFNKLHNKLIPYILLNKFKNYDIVQLISPFFVEWRFLPAKYFLNSLLNNNSSLYMLAAGSDSYYWKFGPKALRYGPFADYLKYDTKSGSVFQQTQRSFIHNKFIAEKCKSIIPVMYDYEVCYQSLKNLSSVIPLPVNTTKIAYRENLLINNKIKVFHGLNRYGFKGTKYVEEAFSYLASKYPNDFEFLIAGQMPYSEYIKVLESANVVIDQTSSYSLGINGVISLAMGKVVLGGAEPESLSSMNLTCSPVINIEPSASTIISALEYLLHNKELIPKIGLASRHFAEKNHNYLDVSRRYLNAWGHGLNSET